MVLKFKFSWRQKQRKNFMNDVGTETIKLQASTFKEMRVFKEK